MAMAALPTKLELRTAVPVATDEERERVLCNCFDGALNAPATVQVNNDVLTGLSLLTFPKFGHLAVVAWVVNSACH